MCRERRDIKKYLFLVISILIFLIDRWSKEWISTNLHLYETRRILGDFLRFFYVKNPRGVFGLPLGGRSLSLAFTLIAFVFVVYLFIISKERFINITLSFIIGGAVGNIYDRVCFGSVIDFIDMGIKKYRWATFNIADAFVTTGILLSLIYWFFIEKKKGAARLPHL